MAEENKEEKLTEETSEDSTQGETHAASQTAEESTKNESSLTTIDYKAELEKKEEELTKARKKIKFTEMNQKKETSEDDSQEPSMTHEEMDDLIDQKVAVKLQDVQKQSLAPQAELLARQMSENDDEAKLIMHYYDNVLRPTGNLIQDIENAKALANKKRLVAQNSELKRKLISNKDVGTGSGAGQKPAVSQTEPTLSKENLEFVAKMGAKFNKDTGRWDFKGGQSWHPND